MHQAVELAYSDLSQKQTLKEVRVEANFLKRHMLHNYFAAIGFEADVMYLISEKGAEYIGNQLYLLTSQPVISVELYEATAEELYMRAETRHFTLGRMYSLISKALGYADYTEARAAAHKQRGQIAVKRLGSAALAYFRPTTVHAPLPSKS